MERLQRLFGWAIVLLWVHMTEQIMFGLDELYELHHVFKTITHGEYFPGAVSSIALATVGCLILKQVWTMRNTYTMPFSRRHLEAA